MDTLVSLAGQFPLLGSARDLDPLADIHASRTEKRYPIKNQLDTFYYFVYDETYLTG